MRFARDALIVLLVLLAVAAIPAYVQRDRIARSWHAWSFSLEKIRELAAIDLPRGAGTVAAGETPYRSGKVVLVIPPLPVDAFRSDNPHLYGDWYALDPSIRAAAPEEVVTVIHCLPERGAVLLRVFDLSRGIFVGEARVEGGFPEDQVPPGAKLDANADRADVAGFVARMPVR